MSKAKHREYVEDVKLFFDRYKVSENNNTILCNCPFCLKYGENIMKPKLYYYKNTGSGYCFRCKTYMMTDKSNELDLLNPVEINTDLENDIINKPEWNKVIISDLVDFHNDPVAINYINNKRSPNYIELMKYLKVKSFHKTENFQIYHGILFPFFYNGECISYQIRFIDDYKLRYRTKSHTKIPYKIIDSENCEYITLTEGIFDALGAYNLGLPSPIALLGKDVPNSVLWFLLQYKNLKGIYIALDEVKLSLEVAKELQKHFPDVEINILKFTNKDPDETYCKGGMISDMFKYTKNYYKEYKFENNITKALNNIDNILKGVNE